MSARKARVEVITRGERRRTWTPEQKREIVSESLGLGQSATEVARKHGISTGQLYTWRQQLLNGSSAVITRVEPRFAQVDVAPSVPAMASEAPAPELARTEAPAGFSRNRWPASIGTRGRLQRNPHQEQRSGRPKAVESLHVVSGDACEVAVECRPVAALKRLLHSPLLHWMEGGTPWLKLLS